MIYILSGGLNPSLMCIPR